MMGWGGRRCLREGGSYSQFHMRWSWCYYKWELIRKRDLNQGNSIHIKEGEIGVWEGAGWGSNIILWTARLDIIYKVYLTLCPIGFS